MQINFLFFLIALIMISFFWGNHDFLSAEDISTSQNFTSQTLIPENLTLPITVEKAVAYRDGGTIGIEIKDSHGKLLSFCVERILSWRMDHTQKRPDFYIGALHPSNAAAKKVMQGGSIEQMVLKILEDWQKNLKAEELKDQKAKLVAQCVAVLKNSGE